MPIIAILFVLLAAILWCAITFFAPFMGML